MKDQLSAFIDGELEIESAEHIITSVKAGGDLKQRWSHYHLIGDVMRNEVPMSHNFTNRVMGALEAEPTILAPNRLQEAIATDPANENMASQHTDSTQSFGGKLAYKMPSKLWSVAASAAAVMFVGVMVLQLNQEEELAPVEIAQSVPTEYLQAHQAAAPNGAAYYIQNASYTEPQQ